mgnify:CR=1 FL=1
MGATGPSCVPKRRPTIFLTPRLACRYAVFEELVAEDVERARAVLAQARKVVPHAHFTFAKLWIHSALFELRQLRLDACRKLLGEAIGRCPKDKLFKEYIQLELQLGEVNRCRTLYAKYLEWAPVNVAAWTAFAELETSLGEEERARAIYELAVEQPALDMPEMLWKAYIDFEIGLQVGPPIPGRRDAVAHGARACTKRARVSHSPLSAPLLSLLIRIGITGARCIGASSRGRSTSKSGSHLLKRSG